MGKYQKKFQKSPRDFYRTIDPRAVQALTPFLELDHTFCEPCAGAGDLIDWIVATGELDCPLAFDIDPQRVDIEQKDAMTLTKEDVKGCDVFITNPPFSRAPLKLMIDHLSGILPTWMLLPADLMHNIYMAEHMEYCPCVVSIGRLWWNENKIAGKENYAWYLFDKECMGYDTTFYSR